MKSDGMVIRNLVLAGIAAFIISACGTVERGTVPWEKKPYSTPPPAMIAVEETSGKSSIDIDETAPEEIRERQEFLKLAYNDWKGIPYILGGSGFNGIDCSAFMQVVFEDYFFIKLPRTTKEQLSEGKSVKKSQAETGDLVFFKTGLRTYHVGVMVNDLEFLHASVSEGVTISSLNHTYWQETYLGMRRIL